jgi:hypothetical protein
MPDCLYEHYIIIIALHNNKNITQLQEHCRSTGEWLHDKKTARKRVYQRALAAMVYLGPFSGSSASGGDLGEHSSFEGGQKGVILHRYSTFWLSV